MTAPPISISNTHDRHRLDEKTIVTLVRAVSEAEQHTVVDLSIVLSDHETVHALNKQHLNHDCETDVLSFPLNDDAEAAVIDGEIYVDLDTAFERCAEFEASFEHEAYRYIVHGLLHLIGYHDETPAQKKAMRAREDRYLDGFINS